MKRSILVLAALAALLLALAAPAQAHVGAPQPHQVATLPYGDAGSFAESMVAVKGGSLYASLTVWGDSDTGQIWRIDPSGSTRLVASTDVGPAGAFMGLALDRAGRLYVADVDFGGVGDSFIYRVGRDGSFTAVADLPPGSWPNGLACRHGYLYASDSGLGAIWRVRLGCGVATPSTPWVSSDLLAPGDPATDPAAVGIGANGIAWRGHDLFVVVSDPGRVVRIPVSHLGVPRTPVVVCERPELRTADGVAFDRCGGLWAVTNAGPTTDQASGALFRVSLSGAVRQILVDPAWFDYPTQPVFGRTPCTAATLYIENGAYSADAAPSVIALKVGVPGRPMP